MRKIWIVRHAESKAQTGEQTGLDTSLSMKGLGQSRKIGSALSEIRFDTVLVSPLRRARETYEASGLSATKARFDSRLIESMPPGGYRDILPYPNLPSYAMPDIHDAWHSDVADRANGIAAELRSSQDENILLISHAMFIGKLMEAMLLGGIRHETRIEFIFHTENASVSLLSFDSQESTSVKIRFWNRTDHLS